MEAEWELCKLERDGIIDAVASEDSDCFVLGCANIIQLIDVGASPTESNCTILSGNRWSDYVKEVLPDATLGDMADFAVLLGAKHSAIQSMRQYTSRAVSKRSLPDLPRRRS